jgi:uncharacterized protein YdhG (YjbR/CyaY superfamily)
MNKVDQHLARMNVTDRTALEHVRSAVKATAPEAEEVITYGMPGFTYKGKYLIAFEAFKDHLSIFPGSEAVEEFAMELKDYKKSKGTVQFSADKTLPQETLIAIIKHGVTRIDKAKA